MHGIRRHRGFTLVEALAAGMLLVMSAAVIGTGVSSAFASLQQARDHQRAAQLLNDVLTRVDLIGPERLSREGPLEGQFDGPDARFSWETAIGAMDTGHLYKVTVTVHWPSGGGVQSARVQTLLNDAPESRNPLLEWSSL